MPAVSVVIPCYNSAQFVVETARSVLAQTFTDFEIIFVDDGSTDGTAAVIGRLLGEDGEARGRIVRGADEGLAASRNLGIGVARGRYILPLDADDLIAPEMLADCVEVLDTDPATSIVFTDREDFGDVEHVWTAGRFELARIKYFNQIGACSMFRRSVWDAVGGYRSNVDGFDDWDFWLAAAAYGFTGHHVARPHFKRRTRRGSFLTRIAGDYERLHAQIVLNHRALFSIDEVAGAERYLATREPAPFLRACRTIFLARTPGVRNA